MYCMVYICIFTYAYICTCTFIFQKSIYFQVILIYHKGCLVKETLNNQVKILESEYFYKHFIFFQKCLQLIIPILISRSYRFVYNLHHLFVYMHTVFLLQIVLFSSSYHQLLSSTLHMPVKIMKLENVPVR